MKVENPQIDHVAITAGQLLSEQRPMRHHESINAGQICGWRALAAAIVVQGVRRAQGALDEEQLSSRDTVRDARRFVVSPWASYLLSLCDIDMELVSALRDEWAEQWALEAEQKAAEYAQHERLPASLVPDWYKKEQERKERSEAIWQK